VVGSATDRSVNRAEPANSSGVSSAAVTAAARKKQSPAMTLTVPCEILFLILQQLNEFEIRELCKACENTSPYTNPLHLAANPAITLRAVKPRRRLAALPLDPAEARSIYSLEVSAMLLSRTAPDYNECASRYLQNLGFFEGYNNYLRLKEPLGEEGQVYCVTVFRGVCIAAVAGWAVSRRFLDSILSCLIAKIKEIGTEARRPRIIEILKQELTQAKQPANLLELCY
jgi:hypothetical protein